MADFKTGVHHRHLHAGAGWTVDQRLPHVQVLAGHPAIGCEGRLAGVVERPLLPEQGILGPRLGVSAEARAGGGDTVSVGQKNGSVIHRAAADQGRVLSRSRPGAEYRSSCFCRGPDP